MDPVRFRDCQCPGTPHAEGDTVTLRPRLSFDQNVAALQAILEAGGKAAAAWPIYAFDGPEAWNLVDANGRPLPLTREALEALDWADQYEIADAADTIYGGQVLAPLLRRMKESSESSRTTSSSRPRRTSSPKPRALPKPS